MNCENYNSNERGWNDFPKQRIPLLKWAFLSHSLMSCKSNSIGMRVNCLTCDWVKPCDAGWLAGGPCPYIRCPLAAGSGHGTFRRTFLDSWDNEIDIMLILDQQWFKDYRCSMWASIIVIIIFFIIVYTHGPLIWVSVYGMYPVIHFN